MLVIFGGYGFYLGGIVPYLVLLGAVYIFLIKFLSERYFPESKADLQKSKIKKILYMYSYFIALGISMAVAVSLKILLAGA